MAKETTGFSDFAVDNRIFKTWYKIVGDISNSNRRPLVVLHGGPGLTHDYMLCVFEMHLLQCATAEFHRRPHLRLVEEKYSLLALFVFRHHLISLPSIPVVFFDQLGSGQSSHYRDAPTNFWTPELFMDQLDSLLRHLKISDNFDLLGHSWGGTFVLFAYLGQSIAVTGFLAAYYAANRANSGHRCLVLANAPASIQLLEKGLNLHLDQFPKEFAEMMRKHEAENTTNAPEYSKGISQFIARHLCSLRPWPRELRDSFAANGEDPTVSSSM